MGSKKQMLELVYCSEYFHSERLKKKKEKKKKKKKEVNRYNNMFTYSGLNKNVCYHISVKSLLFDYYNCDFLIVYFDEYVEGNSVFYS